MDLRYLFLLLLLLNNPAWGQEKIFDYQLTPFESGTFQPVIVSSDHDSSVLLSFFLKNAIRRFRINQPEIFSIIQQNEDSSTGFNRFIEATGPALRNSNRLIWIGSTSTEAGFEDFFYNYNKNKVELLLTRFSPGETKLKEYADFAGEETVAAFFSQDGVFYILSSVNSSNKLKLYKKKCGSDPEIIEKKYDIEELKQQMNGSSASFPVNKLSDLFTKHIIIEDQSSYPVSALPQSVKVYIQKGQLSITVNNQAGICHLVTFSLKDLSSTSRKIVFAKPSGSKYLNRNTGNSFLVDSGLISSYILNDSIQLSYLNLATGATVSTLAALPDGHYKIKKNDFISTGLSASRSPGNSVNIATAISANRSLLGLGIGLPLFILGPAPFGLLFSTTLAIAFPDNKIYDFTENFSLINNQTEFIKTSSIENKTISFIRQNEWREKDCILSENAASFFIGHIDEKTFRYSVYKFSKQ